MSGSVTSPPRRSALYVPGINSRALAKAVTLPADVLIFDLDDAVAPESKAAARAQVCAVLAQPRQRRQEWVVRINGLDTPWGEADLDALLAVAGADALVLPKAESPRQVDAVTARMRRAGVALPLWLMIESPAGVLAAERLAGADKAVCTLVVGTSELTKALRLPPGRGRPGLATALQTCVLAARAHGLDVLDGVHLALKDEEGLAQVCEQGRVFGFDGKTLIHPRQIAVANRIFAPGAIELERARAIVSAWKLAVDAGMGFTVVNGRLVEALHVDEAQRILARADAIAERDTF